MIRMHSPTFVACLMLATGMTTAQAEMAPIPITEWPVNWEDTRPRDPFAFSEDQVWFVGQAGHYVAVLNPNNGMYRRHNLDDGTGPHNLIVAPDNTIWYAGNRAAHIGTVDPDTGAIEKIPMPDPAAVDPHTLVFDSKGDIWFTVQRGNMAGKLTVADESVRLVTVPTPAARPYGIVVDSKDRPWFTLFGSNKLATVDPDTFKLEEVVLPRDGARPRRLVATSDDTLWYVDYAEGYFGHYDPVTGAIEEWLAPGGEESRPYGMAVDDKDNVWFAETGPDPNTFVGFDTKAKTFVSVTDIKSGGGAVRHMHYHAPTRTVWFGTDTHTIGRAQVP